MTTPSSDGRDAERARAVEAALVGRWGEGRIQPTKARIEALMDVLGEGGFGVVDKIILRSGCQELVDERIYTVSKFQIFTIQLILNAT